MNIPINCDNVFLEIKSLLHVMQSVNFIDKIYIYIYNIKVPA